MVSPTKTIPSRILTINAMSSDYTSSSNPSSFTISHITLLLDLLINLSSPPLTTLMSSSPANSPEYNFEWSPSPSSPLPSIHHSPPSKIITNLSPPLIAMFAVASAAFLIVVYTRLLSRRIRRLHRRWKRWRRCRRLLRSTVTNSRSQSQSQSPPPPPHLYSTAFPFSSDSYSDHLLSPHGLDDAAIKTLPISIFSRSKSSNRDCAVCLLEFEDGESLRTLPICSHSFHLECIDAWLRSHPTCPLCRASISFQSDSPFVPMRAARIRPSFEEIVVLEPPPDPDPDPNPNPPITEERCRGFLLKRSYSFGFERSFPGADRDRIVMEAAAATASPAWRLRQHQTSHHQHRGGFWSKRWPSPFGGGGGSARGFYSRPYCYRSGGGMKSPFGKRWGFAPLSGGGVGGGGRRSRSMTSPTAGWMGFPAGVLSSSRLRCGDPEALLSPERFNR